MLSVSNRLRSFTTNSNRGPMVRRFATNQHEPVVRPKGQNARRDFLLSSHNEHGEHGAVVRNLSFLRAAVQPASKGKTKAIGNIKRFIIFSFSGIHQLALRRRNFTSQRYGRFNPLSYNYLHILQGFVICFSISHTTGKLGNFRNKSIVRLTPINDNFMLAHAQILHHFPLQKKHPHATHQPLTTNHFFMLS